MALAVRSVRRGPSFRSFLRRSLDQLAARSLVQAERMLVSPPSWRWCFPSSLSAASLIAAEAVAADDIDAAGGSRGCILLWPLQASHQWHP